MLADGTGLHLQACNLSLQLSVHVVFQQPQLDFSTALNLPQHLHMLAQTCYRVHHEQHIAQTASRSRAWCVDDMQEADYDIACPVPGVNWKEGLQAAGATRRLPKGDSQPSWQGSCPLESQAKRQVLLACSQALRASCIMKALLLNRRSKGKPQLVKCTTRSSMPSRASGGGNRSMTRLSKQDWRKMPLSAIRVT